MSAGRVSGAASFKEKKEPQRHKGREDCFKVLLRFSLCLAVQYPEDFKLCPFSRKLRQSRPLRKLRWSHLSFSSIDHRANLWDELQNHARHPDLRGYEGFQARCDTGLLPHASGLLTDPPMASRRASPAA